MLKSIKVELQPYYRQIIETQGDQRARGESHWACDHMREFDLSFYAPLDVMNIPEETIPNVVIMVNGLNEIDYINYAHYDRIGAYLAPREIGAILHPTPFHLNRTAYLPPGFWDYYYGCSRDHFPVYHEPLQQRPRTPGTIMSRLPHHSMLRRPEAIFHCFEQTSSELIRLAGFLRGADDDNFDEWDRVFYDRFYSRSSSLPVSLLGYSLGGLQALYAFLKRPDLFHRCILINSGAAVDKLRTKPVRISDQHWKRIISQTIGTRIPEDIADWGLLSDILFNRPFKQERSVAEFAKNVGSFLFIAGGADIVSPKEYLAQFIEVGGEVANGTDGEAFAGLNILQVAGLEHPLQRSPIYDQWFPVIMDVIRNFLHDPENEPASYEELMSELSKIPIEGEPWDRWIVRTDGDQYVDARDRNLDVERLINHVPVPDRANFLKYYMISKRYFDNDSDLLRALERERHRQGVADVRPPDAVHRPTSDREL